MSKREHIGWGESTAAEGRPQWRVVPLLLTFLATGIALVGPVWAFPPPEAVARGSNAGEPPLVLNLIESSPGLVADELWSRSVELIRFEPGSLTDRRSMGVWELSSPSGQEPLPARISVPCRPGLHQVRSETYQSFTFSITEQTCGFGELIEVPLYRAEEVSGDLRLPSRSGATIEAAVWLKDCGRDVPETAWLFPLPAEVDVESGAWSAWIPEACRDAQLLFEDLAPVGIEPDLSKTRSSPGSGPARPLKTGVPLTVLVEDSAGRAIPFAEVAIVSAEYLQALLDGHLGGRRLPGLSVVGTTDRRGGLRVPALHPGRYYILAGVAREFPSVVGPTKLDSADRHVTVTVVFTPDAHVRIELAGTQWRVSRNFVLRAWRVADRTLPQLLVERLWEDHSKPLRLDGLPAGRWRFELGARSTDGFSAVAEADGFLDPGKVSMVELRPSLVSFIGEVYRDGVPVVGRLKAYRIENGQQTTADHFARSNADGTFELGLPGSGVYRVEIVADHERFAVLVPDVEFRDPSEVVSIAVPTGSISGRVITDAGDRAELAGVIARMYRDGSRRDVLKREAPIASDGSFELESLNPGVWLVRAVGRRGLASAAKQVRVAEGSNRYVDLRQMEGRKVSGRIESERGLAITGATGRVTGSAGHRADVGNWKDFVTDDHGHFEVVLAPDTGKWVNVEVWAPGYGATARRLRTADEGTVVTVRRAGSLRLFGGGSEWRGRALPGLSLLAPDGAFLQLAGRVESRGSIDMEDPYWEVVVSQLSSGEWRIVDLDLNLVVALLAGRQADVQSLGMVSVAPGSLSAMRLSPPTGSSSSQK